MLKTLKWLNSAFDRLLTGTAILSIVIMLLLSAVVFLVSFSRTALRINIPGLFDASIYALVVFPFLAAAYTTREGRHICIDTFTSRLSKKAGALLNIATYLVSLVYVSVLGWQSALWAASLFRRHVQTDAVFKIPQGIPVSIMVFGCLLLAIQLTRMLVRSLGSLRRERAEVPAAPSAERPWLPASLFVVGIIAGLALFIYVNQLAGLLVLVMVLLFSGMPVFLGLGFLGVAGIYFLLGQRSLVQVPITAYQSLFSFTLTCLPLFILGGLLMEQSGIADDIFNFLEMLVGRWVVSPLLVTILMGMMFDAISGSTTATHAVVGAVALPMLLKRGYKKTLCCGIIGGSATGTLIPPSTGYVVYGVLTGESVGALFMGTLIPSVGLFVVYILLVIILGIVRKKSLFEGGKIPARVAEERRVTWKDRWKGFRAASWGLLTPVIVLGGIATGMFTPTEVAAVLVVYGFLVAAVVKRVSLSKLVTGILRSAIISGMLLCIIFSAFIFAMVISQMRVATNLVAYAQATNMSAAMVTLIIFLVLLVFGLFLEAVSIKVITLPVFYPLALAVGIDGVWLGVFYQFMMEVAGLTPPLGLSLYVLKGVSGLPISTVIKGNIPFVMLMILICAAMYLFPQMVTWLPSIIK